MPLLCLLLLGAGCSRGPTPLFDSGLPPTTETPDTEETGLEGAPGRPVREVVRVPGLSCTVPGSEAVQALDPSLLPAGAAPCRAPELVRVDWLADGDTLHVRRVRDGGEEDVRVIGVDTPEVWGQVECYGPEASDFADEVLDDRLVWLTFDGDCVDPYDRTLAYVHLSASPSCFYERLLLRGGFGRTMHFSETSTHADRLDEDEAIARAGGVGLWGACMQ